MQRVRERFADRFACPHCGALMDRLGVTVRAGANHKWQHWYGSPYAREETVYEEGGGKGLGALKHTKKTLRFVYLTHSCYECGVAAPREMLTGYRGKPLPEYAFEEIEETVIPIPPTLFPSLLEEVAGGVEVAVPDATSPSEG